MTDFVRSGDELVWLLLLELLVILPHPFASFVDYKVLIFQPVNEVYIQHDLNDILSILMLMRVYIIFRSLISKTIYATPRSSRLCYNNGIDHSFLYCVKCILHQNPIIAIGTAEAIMVLILGYALKLSQGTLPDTQDVTPTGFQSFGNCFWIVFVTMGTIGYGDYYPKTVLGRSITVIAAIAGVILSSLLIVALSEYLNLQSNQSKSHITLTRLFQQTKLKQEAKDSLAQTLKVSVFLNQSQNNQTYSSQPELAKIREEEKKKELKNLFDKLKKKIDKTKTRTKQIKNIVDTDNVAEQMNRMFQIFKDCLKEAYQNQMKLKHCFDSLQKQQSEKQHLVIRKTFAQEMQNIMEAL